MSGTYSSLINKIKTQKISSLSPIYFFYGSEEFLKDEAVSIIQNVVIEPSTREFNYNVFHLPETDIATVLYTANSLPFLNEKRLVVLKNFGKMPASQDELFENYLDNPSPTTCMVLIGNDKIPKRKIFEKIENKFSTVNFHNLFENELKHYIIEIAAKSGKTISLDTSEILCEITGRNMLEIKREVEKLILFSGKSKEITADDVEKCCCHFRENTGFDLIPHIAKKEIRKAVEMLFKMLNNGEDGLKILSAITDKYKKYHKFYGFIDKGANEYAALAQVGVRFYKDDFLRDTKNFSREQIKTGLRIILDAELKMKSGGNPEIELEKLLFNLCQF